MRTLGIKYMKRACFVMHNGGITYYGPILKYLPSDLIDLVIIKANGYEQYISEFNLEKFNILTNKEAAKLYEFVIGDVKEFPKLSDSQKSIALFHSMDALLVESDAKRYLNACILPFEKAAAFGTKLKSEVSEDILNLNNLRDRCEIAYTGPWHCGEYIGSSRQHFRAMLPEKIKQRIDPDLPLIFALEGECSDTDELVDRINHIATYANIMFKPFYLYRYPEKMDRISDRVILIKNSFGNNYICRFSADIVMANFYSGSSFTSMMFGQTLISYHSCMEKLKWPNKLNDPLIPFHEFLNLDADIVKNGKISTNLSPQQNFYLYCLKNNLFFNLKDSEKFYSAISYPCYSQMFTSLLSDLHEQILGEFYLKQAAELTADLIMDYIENYEFKTSRSFIYLK